MAINTWLRGQIVVAGTVAALSGLTASGAAQAGDVIDQAQADWRATMHQIPAPAGGCFHAAYPSTQWVRIACAPAPGYRSSLPLATDSRGEVVGNGADFVAQAPAGHTFTSALGSFPKVSGVKTEKSVGVAAFGGGGILGSNEYTLQVNTNFYSNSPACAGYSGCFAWQQYVMSTNTPVSLTSNRLTNDTEVFIEYWLINYGIDNGSNICPSGFIDGGPDATGPGDDCVQNTPAAKIANGQLPIADLSGLTLSGSANAGGTDAATVTFSGHAYTATVADRLTDIASGWTQAEFNVLGNAGGSEAVFNKGSSLTAKIAVTDGSTVAPTCLPPGDVQGTTGETNNLNAGSCTTAGGSSPYIEFTESN